MSLFSTSQINHLTNHMFYKSVVLGWILQLADDEETDLGFPS